MWQTKCASAVPKNLGLGFDFRPCSEGNCLTGRPQSVVFLIHIFARDVLVRKKLEIEKTKPIFIISVLKLSTRWAQFVRFPTFLLIKLLREKNAFVKKKLFSSHLLLKLLHVLTILWIFYHTYQIGCGNRDLILALVLGQTSCLFICRNSL